MLVSWNSTNQCNMFCDHCYRDSGEKAKQELTTQEAKKMITEMKQAGFQIMIFSGGEPLMRKDIYELGSFASSIGLRPVLGTNGSLITKDVAISLRQSGFLAAGVSLDSLNPAKYDDFRKKKGAYESVMQGFENLRYAQLPFQIHTTIMKWNVQELDDMTNFAIQSGAKAHHIFFLVPTGRGLGIEDQILDIHSYENLLTHIVQKQKDCPIELKPTCAPQFMRIIEQNQLKTRFSRGCLAGISYCIVSPIGDVQPCAYLDIRLGNVRDIPFHEIWSKNPHLLRLRTADYSGKCKACGYRTKCGGCRARAFYSHGDYMAEDSYCDYTPSGA